MRDCFPDFSGVLIGESLVVDLVEGEVPSGHLFQGSLMPESKIANPNGCRNGMINISPIGRNASQDERDEFNKYDKQHNIREKFVSTLQEKFGNFGLTYQPLSPILSPYVAKPAANHPSPLVATPSVARSPSTSSRPAGTRPTACATSSQRRTSAEWSTSVFSSSATRHLREVMTTRSMRMSGRKGTRLKTRRIR